jgi:hypothetical protein
MLLKGGGVFSCNAFPNAYPCFKYWLLRIHSEHSENKHTFTGILHVEYITLCHSAVGVTVDVFMCIVVQLILSSVSPIIIDHIYAELTKSR